ncbi:hypothetical protein K7432_012893 [Basidiobolus ranarum]|uniref:Glycosyltransferase N-terminal domain-containing protein n=1 Tax=Basidiobolus ranarum TaxID=34480 RepID=A0ABR2WK39_9FUNG
MAATSRPHLIIFPFPALGHITPALHLASALFSTFEITFVTTTYYLSRAKQILAKEHSHLVADVKIVGLSEGLPEGEGGTDNLPRLAEATEGPVLAQGLENLVIELSEKKKLVAIITDTFLGWAQDIADRHSVPRFIFYTPPASLLSIMFQLEDFHKDGYLSPSSKKLINISGFPKELRLSDLPSHLQDSSKYMFGYFLRHSARVKDAAGIICNTVYELEKDVIDSIRSGEVLQAQGVPIWTVGPMLSANFFDQDKRSVSANNISNTENGSEEEQCLNWLDTQEEGSVIYISFGSVAVLSEPQIHHLAQALLSTNRRFLWVLRQPEGCTSSLPENFLKDTKEQGLIVSWSPQPKVLAHRAVRVFLTHCGWGSSIEAISLGKPLIAWPCFAEQKLNTRFLVDGLHVAIEVEKDENGIADATVISHVIDRFYSNEGQAIAKQMEQLRNLVKKAVKEGGSSKQGLKDFTDAILKYTT